MSVVSVIWVSEQKIGNPTAKHLLHFIATQNFKTPGCFHAVRTLSEELEVVPRTIQKAFRRLEEKNLIKREARFDEKTKRQTTNAYFLNIPKDFVDKRQLVDNLSNSEEKRSSLGVNEMQGEGEPCSGGISKKPAKTNKVSSTYVKKKISNNNINNKFNIIFGKNSKPVTPNNPKSFFYQEMHEKLCIDLNLDIEYQFSKFKDHAQATNKKYSDWNAAFSYWLRKAYEFNKLNSKKRMDAKASVNHRPEYTSPKNVQLTILEANEIYAKKSSFSSNVAELSSAPASLSLIGKSELSKMKEDLRGYRQRSTLKT